jgi:regulator of cell morphogenesis and NO signaling
MQVTEGKHVSEIVAEMPAAARLFERYKIDYCCGGKRPVGEACAEKGVSFDEIRLGLEAMAAEDGQLGYSVIAYRDFLAEELPRLEQLLTKIVNKRYHHLAPALEVFLVLKAGIDQHRMEGTTDALLRLRAATDDYGSPEGVCNTYRAVMHSLQELETGLRARTL